MILLCAMAKAVSGILNVFRAAVRLWRVDNCTLCESLCYVQGPETLFTLIAMFEVYVLWRSNNCLPRLVYVMIVG